MKFNELELGQFWIYTKKKYPCLTKLAYSVLLPFLTSYLCEVAFSALNEIKNKKKERLINFEEKLRVALLKISPQIDTLCKKYQSQISHKMLFYIIFFFVVFKFIIYY